MRINWFPGHMKKTLEGIEKDVKQIDIVLYVLDARAPFSCLNPKIDEIVKNKTILYVINKIDLISVEDAKKIIEAFVKEGKNVLTLQGNNVSVRNILLNKLRDLTKEKFLKAKEKGFEPIFKVMVIGTPNTGKSTIINTLCAQKKTMTGDKAGVTKGKQWVKINENFALLDTPGTLWPKFEDDEVALKLAFIGSIKKDVLDEEELGFELVKFLIKTHQDKLAARYGVEDFEREEIEVYDEILTKTGCIMRGKEIDYTRGASKVLEDFRSGRTGKICLDL
ncbi:MAG: ribosome biogenesis GTPase YlqF [Clostridia bacterium]|nr:ribosome biogenesis GTPase YlqF [Clostridia bacterium]